MRVRMAKPEWGEKHRCGSCGTAFYDMKKDPIICPACGVKNIPEKLLKPRRVSVAEAKPKVVVIDDKKKDEDDILEVDPDADNPPDQSDDLGNDDDDIADVVPVKPDEGNL